jgi:hypothetical protein
MFDAMEMARLAVKHRTSDRTHTIAVYIIEDHKISQRAQRDLFTESRSVRWPIVRAATLAFLDMDR